MDMSKYREMFLSETKEHLGKMSHQLNALRENPADGEGINALFRSAHSIKGMAAAMTYERSAILAHHLEDLLDTCRQQGSIATVGAERLLSGIDLLEDLLDDVAADRPERSISRFFDPPAVAAAPPPSVAAPDTAVAAAPASAPAGDGNFQLRVELAPQAAAPCARALLILRELARRGTVVSSRPSQDQLLQGGALEVLEICLQSEQSRAQVSSCLQAMPDVTKVSFVPPPERPTSGAARREEHQRTVRVSTALLDRFINLTGELITRRYMLQQAAREEEWGGVKNGLDELARLIADLHHDVLQVRMTPLESVTGRLPRLVRELCRKNGKQITVHVDDSGIELDRALLEELTDPLVHMVRNAVDHGIDQEGEIRLKAWRDKDQVLLELADNGRGIDLEVVRSRAIAKGLLTVERAAALSDRELVRLICHPGFSTAPTVTETSGRGVGMDVVKAAVENLGGSLEILSRPGEGTRFRLQLPLSVAILHVLLVDCGGHLVAIPFSRVVRTLELSRQQVLSGRRQYFLDGEARVPLANLSRLLQLPVRPFQGGVPTVLVEVRGRRIGLAVDRLVGHREVFVKPLGSPLRFLHGISGATILGDGSVIFIVDPSSLLEKAPGLPAARATGDM